MTLIPRCAESIQDGSFIRLTLSAPRDKSTGVRKIIARLIELRGKPMLSIATRLQRSESTANHDIEPGLQVIEKMLTDQFDAANLQTTSGDWQWQRLGNGREIFKPLPPSKSQAPERSHDRTKPSTQIASRPWLQAMGLTREDGTPRADMHDKLRQIARFTEILHDTLNTENLSKVRAMDMGCGRGVLTFAMHEYLSQHGTPQTTGVELRPHLVQAANAAASSCSMSGLNFSEGSIAELKCEDTDLLVALHACDTATDDAILAGVRSGVRWMFLAPCCHKEIRPMLTKPDNIESVLRHGIFLERYCEMLTDSLRALWLQAAGYNTRVFEFVGIEHSGRNIMITATRNDSVDRKAANSAFEKLKAAHGLRQLHLEK